MTLAARRRHPAWYVLAGGSRRGNAGHHLRVGVLGGQGGCVGLADLPALGLALHYFIATTMSLVYYMVASRVRLLRRGPVLCGVGYGLLLYGIMNYIVAPLSAAGGGSRDPLWVSFSILVHMFLIGVPIALATWLAHRTRQQS